MRAIDGIGSELRYEWNGELRASRVFKTWEELEAAAEEKRRELEAKRAGPRREPSAWAILEPPERAQ